ncbi:MAG: biopolymer transporter Tol, partial [Candidatus Latescibacteria bacterium]|nr:biopolymer transporter Tol [Candidatus Latescibacterota bacterium]
MLKSTTIFFLMLFTLTSSARAQFDDNHPELNWQKIETEHFRIYYHQGLEKFAQRATTAAEEAYGPVTSFYNFEPDEKVRLILKDTNDYANGGAYYYHNTIEIWVTSFDSELRGTTDWLRNVITHEFTHIVSLQTGRKG